MTRAQLLAAAACAAAVMLAPGSGSRAQDYPRTIRWIKDSAEMIRVPAGEFTMGASRFEFAAKPPHKVFVRDFYMDKYEVTNDKYFRFCRAAARKPPMHMREAQGVPVGRENHPVNHVSFYDAEAYCQWAGKRLPSEEEWEKAAAGTEGRVYPWGDGWDQNLSNNRTSPREDTLPVGSIPRGASAYGLLDMAGNVWEWTSNWYKSYPGSEAFFDDTGKNKVTRGGAYFYSIELLRASYRHPLPPDDKSEYGGFRCAVETEKVKFAK